MARDALVARFMSICCTSVGAARIVSDVAVIAELYLNIGRNGCPEELHRLFDKGRQGHRGPFIIGLPAEGEDLLHKVPRP